MAKYDLVVPTLFGMEAVAAREIHELGYETATEDGRVIFKGDDEAICRCNLWIRSGERVLIMAGRFEATTYDDLFEKTKVIPWHELIPGDGNFSVNGHSLNSKLYSVRDLQSIIQKAVVESMKRKYPDTEWFDGRNGVYKIEFLLLKNIMTLMIDTTGDALHKRGYRETAGEAPLRESLAAAMVMLSYWKSARPFLDPFCGSGTIPIEAAMIGANIAPGLNRRFVCEDWCTLPTKYWNDARKEARESEKRDVMMQIEGSDVDGSMIELAIACAKKAGVNKYIRFDRRDIKNIAPRGEYGSIICNPPYGLKILDLEEAETIYAEMGKVFRKLPTWSVYVLTPDEKFEELYGKKAAKKRKLYNGKIKCDLYQYPGPKPPYV